MTQGVPHVTVERHGDQATVTITGAAEALHRLAVNLSETDRLSFRELGEAIAAGLVRAAADRPDPEVHVGVCEGCGEPIYDGQPHGRDRETGDLWHVECREEGSDDLD